MMLSQRCSRFSPCLPFLVALAVASSEIAETGDQRTCGRSKISKCINKYADRLDAIEEGLGDDIRSHPRTVKASSRRPVVFGVGSGTTGTRSLGVALHKLITHFGLDMKVSHWLHSPEENCDWIGKLLDNVYLPRGQCQEALREFDYTGMANSVGAILDYPIYELFIDFFLAFPNARWVLTTRPSDDWAAARKEDHAGTPWPMHEPCGFHVQKNTSSKTLSRVFDSTNDFIRCVVPTDHLLEIDFFSDGTNHTMKNLRKFLGFETDDLDHEEFPHTSSNSEGRCNKNRNGSDTTSSKRY